MAHERRDLAIRPLVIFGAMLIASVVAIHLGSTFVQDRLSAREGERKGRPAPPRDPPTLSLHPEEDLLRQLEEERLRLATYGWINREAGILHIPIERAMDLVAERGLPARKK